MKTFKTLALIAALSATAFTSTTFAADGSSGFEPLSIKVCNQDGSCQSPNGPSLDGLAQPSGIKQHGHLDLNGPSLDGLVQPSGIRQNGNLDLNGPSLDGLAQPSGIKVCNSDTTCMSPNGPSETVLADLKLGTVIIAIDMP